MPSLDNLITQLQQYLEQYAQIHDVPGMAAAVTDRDKTLHTFRLGYANLETQAPITAETLFEIGSISKSFTAIALMQLQEAGLVDVHEPVTRYLPWFYVRSKHEPITLHHLLTHTAGIINGQEGTPTARGETWALRDTATGGPPGERFHYSNVGYKAVGVVLEELLNQPYADIMRERILDPLGMAATEPVLTQAMRGRLAIGYVPHYDDRPFPRGAPVAPTAWIDADTGDGSIASTPDDMAAYVRLLLNRGQGPRGQVLSEASFNQMITPVIPMGDEPGEAHYGYGYSIYDAAGGHTVIGHGGSMMGYMAALLADLDAGLGVILLCNGQRSMRDAAQGALRILRGEEVVAITPPDQIDNAADYVGSYHANGQTLTVEAEGDRLHLRRGGQRVALEAAGERDEFHALHGDFELFLMRFGRDGEGKVVEICHGPNWYAGEGYVGPRQFEAPEAWRAYIGHYRSHNPWYSNFRVIFRKGRLFLVGLEGEEAPLVALEDGTFRLGDDERSPERVAFDLVLNGKAERVNRSGELYYRTFTP